MAAPLVCTSGHDTHTAGHPWSQGGAKPPGITEICVDFVWHEVRSGVICLGLQHSLCNSVWKPWPELWSLSPPCLCTWAGLCFPRHKQGSSTGSIISLSTKKVNAGNALFWNISTWQPLPSISRPVKSLYINCVVISVICLMSPCLAVWETVSKYKNTVLLSWESGLWLH